MTGQFAGDHIEWKVKIMTYDDGYDWIDLIGCAWVLTKVHDY